MHQRIRAIQCFAWIAIAVFLIVFRSDRVAAAQGSDAPADSAVADSSVIEAAMAPSDVAGTLEGITEQMQTMVADLDRLRRFKLSGYLQVRWESSDGDADTVKVIGNPSVFTPANVERFYIRRARIKLSYDHSPWSQAVVQIDGASDRQVRILDVYAAFTEPRTPEPRYQAWVGQMNVPFGYEVERSSSIRELPERSRAENVLFPGERDRGVKLMALWAGKLETVVGAFNGGGIGNADFPNADPNRNKDVVGRVRATLGVFDAAVSGMTGRATTPLTGPDVTTNRTRVGFDAQTYYTLPTLGGGSLKLEYDRGRNVNADSVKALTVGPDAANPVRLLAAGANPAHFATVFSGGYAQWVQNLGERFQFAARYDWFDPDENADHDRYRRWNAAAHWFYQGLTRVTVSYEHPITERRVAAGVYADPVDNLWTVQFQHAF